MGRLSVPADTILVSKKNESSVKYFCDPCPFFRGSREVHLGLNQYILPAMQ